MSIVAFWESYSESNAMLAPLSTVLGFSRATSRGYSKCEMAWD